MSHKDYKLVTDETNSNMQAMHNMVFVKDKNVFLRTPYTDKEDGFEDINLVDFTYKRCHEKGCLDLPKEELTGEKFGEHMECGCDVCLMYWLAVGFAEVREKLKEHEAE